MLNNTKILHEKKLAFFGKITASISHELNNVLSIINEYSGLLDDLVLAAQRGKPLDESRIQKIANNISTQVKRQESIIELLNKFAHRVDIPILTFNLNEVVKEICRLSERFASLKKVNLDVNFPDEQIMLTSNPFELQHIVFSFIRLGLDMASQSETISIGLEQENTDAIIKIAFPSFIIDTNSGKKMELISHLVTNLGAELDKSLFNEDSKSIKIFIPISHVSGITDQTEDSYNEP